jgi:hypothetical protein
LMLTSSIHQRGTHDQFRNVCLWPVAPVVLNAAAFIIFAFRFARPYTKRG